MTKHYTDSNEAYQLYLKGTYAKSGRRYETEEVIKRFREIAKTRYVMSYYIASIFAALGDKEKALRQT